MSTSSTSGSSKLIGHVHIVAANTHTEIITDGEAEVERDTIDAAAYNALLQRVNKLFHDRGVHNLTVQVELMASAEDEDEAQYCHANFGCKETASWCCPDKVTAPPTPLAE
ncbi:hypothetical protein KIPB_009789 [Kipferlia bialata]|uniref:Uncharacterized protein n=1 Tax=Kipferlia bialata TaxID=797122 RepID=A0A9K3D3Q6_9EUKA|nr:hypothetical protein KIPB_009789 [Kipferlia bialata]|eukprot:g9789.t1